MVSCLPRVHRGELSSFSTFVFLQHIVVSCLPSVLLSPPFCLPTAHRGELSLFSTFVFLQHIVVSCLPSVLCLPFLSSYNTSWSVVSLQYFVSPFCLPDLTSSYRTLWSVVSLQYFVSPFLSSYIMRNYENFLSVSLNKSYDICFSLKL